MFNLSFSEIFLILILAIIFLKPSDFPMLINGLKKLFNKFLAIKNSVLDELEELKDGFKEIEEDLLENDKIIKKEQTDDN